MGIYRDNGKENGNYYLGFRVQGFEGPGDLVSRLIMGTTRVAIWFVGVVNLLAMCP